MIIFFIYPGLGSPYFQNTGDRSGDRGMVNVTTQLESTTYLDCHVNRLGGKTVSIIPTDDDGQKLLHNDYQLVLKDKWS